MPAPTKASLLLAIPDLPASIVDGLAQDPALLRQLVDPSHRREPDAPSGTDPHG